ncbi:MAG: 1-deoxy-D-xylulose-5-phosphate reductoisomerase [Sphaerochaetaceae bacterium]
MKRIIILGCTGSIGTTTLQAIRNKDLPLQVVGLSSNTRRQELVALAREFKAEALCLTGARISEYTGMRTYTGIDGLQEMLQSLEADIVLNAIAGFEGLRASLFVLRSGCDLALANKESVVCAGSYLFEVAKEHNASIIPVDSEHSALAELLKGRTSGSVDSLILTASGGPFRTLPKEQFGSITVEQALAHPTWNMGKKITIDSATLANKALEVIEASYLFNFDHNHIEVVVHPQSIVHSMIRTTDGAVYAQLGVPDMTLPIINALSDDQPSLITPLDFSHLSLDFSTPDYDRFPLLGLAFSILERKHSSALAFNAADEIAVEAFLQGRISYPTLIEVVKRTLDHQWNDTIESYEQTLALDKRAREIARSYL